MARLERLKEAKREVQRAALERYLSRAPERRHNREVIRSQGIGAADTPQRQERYKKRVTELDFARSIGRGRLPIALERRMGATLDFTPFAPSEGARRAGRPVARIVAMGGPGVEPEGFATGFIVHPGILLTNHHVFPFRSDARGVAANFCYERSDRGLERGVCFELDPDRFYVSDERLDFAFVAVRERAEDGKRLSDFGQITLIEATPKILKGQPVNIIQHPEGGPKQYAIAENRLIDILETDGYLHYETDTLEGSSGSPAFSQQWELVALHHASIPLVQGDRVIADDGSFWSEEMGDHRVRWVANEGTRVSSIVGRLSALGLPDPAEQRLLTELIAGTVDPAEEVAGDAGLRPQERLDLQAGHSGIGRGDLEMSGVQFLFTGPVTINVHGAMPGQPSAPAADLDGKRPLGATTATEASIRFDPDYDRRAGYDPTFLDPSGGIVVPTPTIHQSRVNEILTDGAGEPLVLKYHHFELVMNKSRRLQMWSAVNVDYDPKRKSTKGRDGFGRDRWIPDPRIPARDQIFDADFYKPAGNIDRGHIVRREDNAWGDDEREQEFANSDTFHWTNCTPQHEAFNQSAPGRNDAVYRGMEGIWGALENHVQASRKGNDTKACILAGPVLAGDDRTEDFGRGEVQYPLRFWKVVCIADDDGSGARLKAFGFLLDQTSVVERFGIERFDPGRFRRYQVPLARIQEEAGVVFDPVLLAADDMGAPDGSQDGGAAVPEVDEDR